MSIRSPGENGRERRSVTDGVLGAIETFRLLQSAGGALIVQAGLHAELVRTEWQREKRRLAAMLGFAIGAMLCAACLLIGLGALAVVAGWNTGYRIPIAIAVCLVYAIAGYVAWQRMLALAAQGDEAFAATRAELRADLAMLRSRS